MSLTLQERLSIYRKAKEDYRTLTSQTINGFCWYFDLAHGIKLYKNDLFSEALPELFQQKPTTEFHLNKYSWFETYGPIPERVSCLEAAIKMCEERLAHFKKIEKANREGYAGCLPTGMLVDRREQPEAYPIAGNPLFNVAQPRCTKCGEQSSVGELKASICRKCRNNN